MEKKEQQNGGLSSGFLLGVVVGVIITLLLTTKRGKRLLKLIAEEGISKLSNLEDMFTDISDDYETKPQEPKLPPVTLIEEQEPQEALHIEKEEEQERHPFEKKEASKPIKRFFKGIPRHGVN